MQPQSRPPALRPPSSTLRSPPPREPIDRSRSTQSPIRHGTGGGSRSGKSASRSPHIERGRGGPPSRAIETAAGTSRTPPSRTARQARCRGAESAAPPAGHRIGACTAGCDSIRPIRIPPSTRPSRSPCTCYGHKPCPTSPHFHFTIHFALCENLFPHVSRRGVSRQGTHDRRQSTQLLRTQAAAIRRFPCGMRDSRYPARRAMGGSTPVGAHLWGIPGDAKQDGTSRALIR